MPGVRSASPTDRPIPPRAPWGMFWWKHGRHRPPGMPVRAAAAPGGCPRCKPGSRPGRGCRRCRPGMPVPAGAATRDCPKRTPRLPSGARGGLTPIRLPGHHQLFPEESCRHTRVARRPWGPEALHAPTASTEQAPATPHPGRRVLPAPRRTLLAAQRAAHTGVMAWRDAPRNRCPAGWCCRRLSNPLTAGLPENPSGARAGRRIARKRCEACRRCWPFSNALLIAPQTTPSCGSADLTVKPGSAATTWTQGLARICRSYWTQG